MKGKHRNIVLTTVKLKNLWSLFVIGLHKVQTQNLLFTFTWNVKKAQNNFVLILTLKSGLIHECDLYSSKYGTCSGHSGRKDGRKGGAKIRTCLNLFLLTQAM